MQSVPGMRAGYGTAGRHMAVWLVAVAMDVGSHPAGWACGRDAHCTEWRGAHARACLLCVGGVRGHVFMLQVSVMGMLLKRGACVWAPLMGLLLPIGRRSQYQALQHSCCQ
jgi:hypothetical protein